MFTQLRKSIAYIAASLLIVACWFMTYDIALAVAINSVDFKVAGIAVLVAFELLMALFLVFNCGHNITLVLVGAVFAVFTCVSWYSKVAYGICDCMGRDVNLGWGIVAIDAAVAAVALSAYVLSKNSETLGQQPVRWKSALVLAAPVSIIIFGICFSSVRLGWGAYSGKSTLAVRLLEYNLQPESTRLVCDCTLVNPTVTPLWIHGAEASCGVSFENLPNQLVPSNGEYAIRFFLPRGAPASVGVALKLYVSSDGEIMEDSISLR